MSIYNFSMHTLLKIIRIISTLSLVMVRRGFQFLTAVFKIESHCMNRLLSPLFKATIRLDGCSESTLPVPITPLLVMVFAVGMTAACVLQYFASAFERVGIHVTTQKHALLDHFFATLHQFMCKLPLILQEYLALLQ